MRLSTCAIAHGVTTAATFGLGVLAPITLLNLISIPKVHKHMRALNVFDQMSLEEFILDHPEEIVPFLAKDLPNDLNQAMAPIREKIKTARAELKELTQIKVKLADPASTEFSASEKVERLSTIEKTIPEIERQLIDWQKNYLDPVNGVLNESIPSLLALVQNRLRLQMARDDVDDALARITGNAARSSADLEENEEQIKIAIERLAKVLSDFDAASKAQHEVAMLSPTNKL